MFITYISIAIICLLFSAFFSASETAITASSKPFLLHQEQKGLRRAKIINKLLKQFDLTITCLLIGNNLVNVLFTALLTTMFINAFGDGQLMAFSLFIVVIILIIAEILPKTIAFINPTKLALALAPIIYLIVIIIIPFSKVFLLINKFITYNVFRINKNNSLQGIFTTKDNLRGAIEMFGNNLQQTISKEKQMLHGVLDLQELQVADIINHRKDVYTINIDDNYDVNLKKILASPYTLLPVFSNNSNNSVIGILNVKNILKTKIDNLLNNNILNIDFKKQLQTPYVVPETTFVLNLLEAFKEKQERMAIIVDEYGSFMGILTLGDILEEITGELESKEQKNAKNSIVISNNSYIVAGDLKIRDLNRKMNWKLPDEEFTTVAGLILYETGKIPNIGSSFAFHNFKFTILEKRKHQLVKIKITPLVNN